tara:strand:+ start:543 stop:866 length:324 start_codon:yes stop_codon:yes gene_type:complete
MGSSFSISNLNFTINYSTKRRIFKMKREPQLPEFNKKKKTQIERDIAYCIDILGLNNGQIGEMFRACEELGNISVQYFCEEFIFLAEMDELERYHNDNYLPIKWGLL